MVISGSWKRWRWEKWGNGVMDGEGMRKQRGGRGGGREGWEWEGGECGWWWGIEERVIRITMERKSWTYLSSFVGVRLPAGILQIVDVAYEEKFKPYWHSLGTLGT